MLASELIERLRRMVEDHGDADVVMAQDESDPAVEYDADNGDFVIS